VGRMTIRVKGITAPRSRPPISHVAGVPCSQAAIAERVPRVKTSGKCGETMTPSLRSLGRAKARPYNLQANWVMASVVPHCMRAGCSTKVM
jgi:hypothetical protein